MGDLMKVDLQRVKCICGKALGSGAAICAACGMASCSEACHRRWEQEGNCVFSKNFYSTPEGSTMRSILFDNVYKMRDAKIREWYFSHESGRLPTDPPTPWSASMSPQTTTTSFCRGGTATTAARMYWSPHVGLAAVEHGDNASHNRLLHPLRPKVRLQLLELCEPTSALSE